MAEFARAPGPGPDREGTTSLMRADALASRQRILHAARMLEGDRHVTMAELAAAANVGRSTLYRHFPTRAALERALSEFDATESGLTPAPVGRVATMPFQAPGQLGRESPLSLEVTRVLDEVPPHLVADQLVAEARRAAGVAVALYVVDIDGSHLLRLAGSEEFPEQLEAPPALGPEIVPEGLPEFHERLQRQFPGCIAEPLWLRGRVTGLLLCVGAPPADLDNDDFYVTAIVARWRAATGTLTWANCGHPPAYVVDVEGNMRELEGPRHPALGTRDGETKFKLSKCQLHSGDRLLLVTDGIIE